jgi:mRNA-degrading endonuclease YafQ of YafQ-DinJ toxin-antitoxin module
LKIWVRSGGINTPTIPVGDVGSLPVRAGHSMQLQVIYNQKAHTYLLWVNSEGQVTPLYPWNMDDIEIKDADTVPPKCLATDILESPATIGKGWIFAKQPGLETVLLLGRKKPLEKNLKLGSLLGKMKTGKNQHPQESAILVWDREKKSIQYAQNQNRPTEDSEKNDQELKEIMTRLAEDFEVVFAYRFVHEK